MPDLNYVLTNDYGQKYIEVPISKYARCYFQTEHKAKGGYLYAQQANWLGGVLGLMSEKSQYRRVSIRRKSMMCKMKIVLPQDYEHAHIAEGKLTALGNHLEGIFVKEFLAFVKGAVATGCSDNFAVVRFLDVYKIKEEDWSLDTAKKTWRDYKKIRLNVPEIYGTEISAW